MRSMTRKRFVAALGTAASLVLALMCPALARADEPAAQMDAAAAGTLTIVHTNDIHGTYAVGDVDYFAAVKGLADEEGAQLVLDAGDTFHGTSFATIQNGENIAELMRAADYDATTPGNHDWSYGSAQLAGYASEDGFSVMAANVVTDDGEPFFSDPYLIKDVQLAGADGEPGATVTVGVFGVIDPDFYTSTPSYNVEGLRFTDPVAAANKAAAELREQGCDVVIALTHNADPTGFAAQTTGVDAVIAGHEHILLDEVVTSADGTQVPVVEAGDHGAYVGELELEISQDADGAYAVATHAETAHAVADLADLADADVATLTDQLVAENQEALNEVIGTSTQDYAYPDPDYAAGEPGGWELVRTEDTSLGHFVTSAYLDATGADVAIENAGGIRGGITAGDVTAGDILSISPYGNTLSTYTLTGQQILDSLEHSLDIMYRCRTVLAQQIKAIANGEDYTQYTWPDESGSVLVMGGLTLEINWEKPEGQRVVSATVVSRGAALDVNATYTVAMNSYLPGSSEYPAFSAMTLQKDYGTCEQLLRSYVAQDGWEDKVYALSGTVAYVDNEAAEDPGSGVDDPAENPQEKPSENPEDATETPVPAKPAEGADQNDGAGAKVTAGNLPQTSDPAIILAGLAAAGAGCAGVGAGLRRRTRRARSSRQSERTQR